MDDLARPPILDWFSRQVSEAIGLARYQRSRPASTLARTWWGRVSWLDLSRPCLTSRAPSPQRQAYVLRQRTRQVLTPSGLVFRCRLMSRADQD